tara:strand:+ start:430943 stop:431650 length:708 start_codon:yes stop_codon:yes gene_type:complete
MWSGPRNISTAMMRSFENRDDTQVIDEPFYAWYLHTTGIEHPMNREVIASQPTDWRTVANTLSAEREGVAVVYQKHMTHHMLPEIDLGWTSRLRNCFLIRDPVYVVNSYAKKRDTLTQDDIGIRRQFELYNEIADITGQQIPVVDAAQFLVNPERHLRALCTHFGIGFSDKMLSWPKGRRDSDGVWAAHWYEVVEQSTGFQTFTAPALSLSPLQQSIAEEAGEYYQLLLSKSLAL